MTGSFDVVYFRHSKPFSRGALAARRAARIYRKAERYDLAMMAFHVSGKLIPIESIHRGGRREWRAATKWRRRQRRGRPS